MENKTENKARVGKQWRDMRVFIYLFHIDIERKREKHQFVVLFFYALIGCFLYVS